MSKFSASIYNYLSNSLNAIVMLINGIVLVPFYFQYMSLSTYGAWLASGNVVAMLGMLESGLSIVITQKLSVAHKNNDSTHISLLAGANIFSAIIISLIIFFIGLIISFFVADLINADILIKQDITIAFIVALAASTLSIMTSLFGAFPQVWQDTKTVGIIGIIANIIGIISTIIYLLVGFGVIALALAYFTRALLNLIGQCIWIFIKWRKCNYPKPKYDFTIVLNLLKDCFYPFLSKLSTVVMNNSQSFIISSFINPGMAAIYDITQKVIVVLSNFVNMTNVSFFALYSLTFASKNRIEINNIIIKIANIFMILLFTAVLYSAVFTKSFVHFWVGLDKYGGDILLLMIVFSVLVSQIKQYTNILLQAGGMISKSAKLDIMSMILFVILLLSFIKSAGIYTIPVATIFSGLIFIVLYLRLLRTKLTVEVNVIIRLIVKSFLITSPFILSYYLLDIDLSNFRHLIIFFLLFSIVYLVVLFATNKQYAIKLSQRIKYGKSK